MSEGMTVRQLWEWLAAGQVSDAVLEWAPDVAALTSVLLERSHAFRFVVSPPEGAAWPPPADQPFPVRVGATVSQWRAAMDGGGEPPDDVRRCWSTLMDHLDTSIATIAQGTAWPACEAALELHAIADEASAGCGGGVDIPGPGLIFRARARELLARTGSMARLPVDRVRQLPKSRTTSVGITHRSLSRYTCTTTEGIGVVWDRVPLRRRDDAPVARHANIMLLPWPLRLRESDFVPVPGSVRRAEREPFGFFTYEPSEPLDLELVDQLLDAAVDEVDGVDVVVLPEGFLAEADIDPLESLLARRGVSMLVSGLRPEPATPGGFAKNLVHTGLLLGGHWWHYRQNKHHRWFLEGSQIEAYNIAGSLHPSVRWWEAMEIPERSVHFLELGGGFTVAAVVCEDLARLDGVAQLLRSAGPTLVLTLLLDGPQLGSRWTARYASVLADDPGSVVLTLTAYGMVARSQPRGMPPSRVIALWKDPVRGLREIPLEDGAQGVLLKGVLDRSARYSADGRKPVDDVTDFYVAGVYQLRSKDAGTLAVTPSTATPSHREAPLEPGDLTVLSAWAQAVAHAVPGGAETVEAVLRAALPDADWRSGTLLAPPTGTLAEALQGLVGLTRSTFAPGDSPHDLRLALKTAPTDETDARSVVRETLVTALEAVAPD
ncbi:MAG: hypothetical protein R2720_00810 [Candidatus Nanopelagicales bacterium]